MIICGDSLEVLKTLDENSVDAVVTDPPYGWRFMGKAWDKFDIEKTSVARVDGRAGWTEKGKDRKAAHGSIAQTAGEYNTSKDGNWQFMLWTQDWATEILRVLKPGGHMLVFCGPRTYHAMAMGVEQAGFEIRDQLQWLFGSGFPKSLDVSKAIDKAAGAEREVIGVKRVGMASNEHLQNNSRFTGQEIDKHLPITTPASDSAKQWQGWGTALKPANEPIVLARKPLSEKTVAKNVERWGTGALNIDASRIENTGKSTERVTNAGMRGNNFAGGITEHGPMGGGHEGGRWPANLILDERAAELLDEQSGVTRTGGSKHKDSGDVSAFGAGALSTQAQFVGDSGGASRFFYVAKASKRERNAGLEFTDKSLTKHNARPADWENTDWKSRGGNHHPTVKPIKLMEYLCTLITPPGGTVLDPFCGSGSTGVAAVGLGFKFIGIEREAEYVEIANKRIEHAGLA